MTNKENITNIVAGIDIGGTTVSMGIMDSEGTLLNHDYGMAPIKKGVETVVEWISERLYRLIHRTPEVRLCGIGIGIAGLVDAQSGTLKYAANLAEWKSVPLARLFYEKFDVPVFLENDANVAALGEYAYGAGERVHNMVLVTLGTGVGAGLILNGEIYRGVHGLAGEIGHTIIQKDGPLCGCGRRGCLEAFIGNAAIVQRTRELCNSYPSDMNDTIQNLTTKDISLAAEKGDSVALKVYKEVGETLAVGLSNVFNLLNIQRAVISGGVARASCYFLETTRLALNDLVLDEQLKPVKVVPASLGDNAGLLGAAHLAIKRCGIH